MREWKVQRNYTLERFVSEHHNTFVSMQAASEHLHFQIPNENSLVGYLPTAINCVNTVLQAEIESIKTDKTPTGLRTNFEASASHLLPYDPVQKKHSNRTCGKHNSADITDMTVERGKVSSFGTKKGFVKSRVHLC